MGSHHKTITARDDVWAAYLMGHPNHHHMRTSTFKDFEDLQLIFESAIAKGNTTFGLGGDSNAETFEEDDDLQARDDVNYMEINDNEVNETLPKEKLPTRKRSKPNRNGDPSDSINHGESSENVLTEMIGVGTNIINLIQQREERYQRDVEFRETQKKKNNGWDAIKEISDLEDHIRYNAPLVTKRFTTTDYAPLIEQIKKRIESWTARYFSFAGRLNLISSVLWSICNFWLAAFRLPRECIDRVEKLCSAFLWLGAELNTHKAKISWEKVCKPKHEGGLGLRSLKEANNVCCLKLVWRIVSHGNSLWVSWVKENLLKKSSFWSLKSSTSMGSWIWKKIIKYRDVAKNFCKVEVGNGENTSFWFDHWSSLGCLYDTAGARGIIDLGINRTSTVAQAWSNHRRRRHRSPFLNETEAALFDKWQQRSDKDDIVLWKSKNDVFSPKFSTKDIWNHIRTTSTTITWHKGVWFAHATPKYSFCVWLAAQDRLSTGDRMLRWKGGTPGLCVFCKSCIETRDHLFFSYGYVSEIWASLAKGILKANYSTDWAQLIVHISKKPSKSCGEFPL